MPTQTKQQLWREIQQRDPYLAELIKALQAMTGEKLKDVKVVWK
jgi:hypothetical protein